MNSFKSQWFSHMHSKKIFLKYFSYGGAVIRRTSHLVECNIFSLIWDCDVICALMFPHCLFQCVIYPLLVLGVLQTRLATPLSEDHMTCRGGWGRGHWNVSHMPYLFTFEVYDIQKPGHQCIVNPGLCAAVFTHLHSRICTCTSCACVHDNEETHRIGPSWVRSHVLSYANSTIIKCSCSNSKVMLWYCPCWHWRCWTFLFFAFFFPQRASNVFKVFLWRDPVFCWLSRTMRVKVWLCWVAISMSV